MDWEQQCSDADGSDAVEMSQLRICLSCSLIPRPFFRRTASLPLLFCGTTVSCHGYCQGLLREKELVLHTHALVRDALVRLCAIPTCQ